MNPTLHAVRVGLRRGATEVRHSLRAPEETSSQVITALVVLVVLYFQRDTTVAGTSVSLASLALPGVVGALVALNTLTGAAFVIACEREDGTLLRARATPHGLVGYVAGQVVRVPAASVCSVVLLLVPGLFLFDELAGTSLGGWLTLVGMVVLGLAATLPLGLALGGLTANPRTGTSWLFLISAALIAISGIFYPIAALPGWLHPVAQVFPFYWLGLGVRSALLPDAAAAVELTGSWQSVATVGVLGTWAVLGLVLAPFVLRRMARRVSGATVEAGRLKATQRIG